MGRIGGMTEAISQLMSAMGLDLSPWVAPLFVLVLFFALLPRILRNMRTSKARKMLKRAWMLGADEEKLATGFERVSQLYYDRERNHSRALLQGVLPIAIAILGVVVALQFIPLVQVLTTMMDQMGS